MNIRNEKVLKKEAEMCLFIAEHTSLATADHLGPIFQRYDPDLKCKRSKCTAIIKNVLSPHFITTLRKDVLDGPGFYSLLLDESTDISTIKFLGMSIMYYSSKKREIVCTFLKLEPVEAGDAQTLSNAVIKVLNEFGFPLKNLIGIGTDNANVMTGQYNGVYSILKEKVPNLLLIRCMSHSLQLAVTHACRATLPRSIMYIVDQTYSWFSRSSDRQIKYKNLYTALHHDENNEPLKIPRQCDTRWLSIENSISRILDQWDYLKQHFDQCRISDKCFTAETLFNLYNDEANLAFFKFLQPYLAELRVFNDMLQNRTPDHTKLYISLTTLMTSWINAITLPNRAFISKNVFDTTIANIEQTLSPDPYLGYAFETQVKKMVDNGILTAQEMKINIKQRCVRFLIELISQFQIRLPENAKNLRNMRLISLDNCLNQRKESIVPLLQQFKYNDMEITRIEKQWMDLVLLPWSEKNNVQHFWGEVYHYRDLAGNNPFRDVALFAIKLLTLPHSNAEVERVFSQLNIVKTKVRNKLIADTINAILSIRYGLKRTDDCCYSYTDKLPSNVLREISQSLKYVKEKESESESNEKPNEDDDDVTFD